MNLASSTKHVFLVLGIGVLSAACGGDDTTPDAGNTTYTWTKVSTDIKSTCAIATSCHANPTSPAQIFDYNKTLTPGSDQANYNTLTTATPALIDKTTPANSLLLTVGKGGMYNGMPHSASLSATTAANWQAWIAAGATFQ